MKILIVHPLMSAMGGGERLCCETIRALKNLGFSLTLLSADFSPSLLERFFGYQELFDKVDIKTYPAYYGPRVGRYEDLIRHVRAQRKILSDLPEFDLVFSTQDPGFIPDVSRPVLQWGYFPIPFRSGLYEWPLRTYYAWKVKRIGLVLAISNYSKTNLDRAWKIPSRVIYPACNMIETQSKKENIVITAARAVPEKRLELFWDVAKRCNDYEFVLLLTQDPRFTEYSQSIKEGAPNNGRVLVNAPKDLYQQALAQSKFYLHMMKGEHFGITVVEAMSAGCVPIVHNSGGPREIVGNSGCLWQQIQDVPKLIAEANNNYPSLSASSIRRARDFSRERFDESLGEVFGETA